MDRPTILLLHGANHGAWCWSHVAPHLDARGFKTLALDLPGRSRRWGWLHRLDTYATAALEAASTANAPVIAVGHSMGGMVMSAAAQRRPELFQRLVFVTAFLPRDGDSLAALGGQDKSSRLAQGIRVSLVSGRVEILPGGGGDVFFGDCSEEQRRWAFDRLSSEPLGLSIDKVRLTADRFGQVARSYVRCTEDQALSIAFQDEMIARQPCEKVATLRASHSPFLSMPEALADAIVQVV